MGGCILTTCCWQDNDIHLLLLSNSISVVSRGNGRILYVDLLRQISGSRRQGCSLALAVITENVELVRHSVATRKANQTDHAYILILLVELWHQSFTSDTEQLTSGSVSVMASQSLGHKGLASPQLTTYWAILWRCAWMPKEASKRVQHIPTLYLRHQPQLPVL